MATKLFLRDTAANGIGNYFDSVTTAGSATATGVVDTTASGTEIQWTQTAGGTVLEFISGRVPSGGFTLSGTMTFSIWAHQSHMNANCGARSRVFKRTAAGVETEVGGGPYNDGVEFGTSSAEMVWTGTPTSTAFAENDRIIVRYYITNVGTMGGGFTCTLTYNGADAATGDSFFQINENVTFKAETTNHAATGTLTGQLGSVAGSAVHIAHHTTTGALAGPSSAIAGSASSATVRPSTGALVGSGSTVAGSSARTRAHASTGALTGAGASVSGSAARTRIHVTTAILAGLQASIAGSAARSEPGGAVTHSTDGALAGQLGALAGIASRAAAPVAHSTSGVLVGEGPAIAGFALAESLFALARRTRARRRSRSDYGMFFFSPRDDVHYK